jgi:glycerol-3-phosphate dehydrogenase
MWTLGWRQEAWDQLKQPWDVIVVGGGITGAGILRESARAGLRTILVDAKDFASGTSSRSSKLVHGGLRYLKNGQIRLTYESVREREQLLSQARGLVSPLGFFMPTYRNDKIPGWVFGAGLILYDLFSLKWAHQRYSGATALERWPYLRSEGLIGGYRYFDAQTDDARLVLRVIREAVRDGGCALNYARVVDLLRNSHGEVCGVRIEDQDDEHQNPSVEVQAPVVINATGAWADGLRANLGGERRLRLLRGSHILLPAEKVPISRAISFWHPHDQRPVFIFPWEGVVIVGTTDVDHRGDLELEPSISPAEAEYLIVAARFAFPSLNISLEDVQSTLSGIRAVVDTGKTDPSKESREHVLWLEKGLLTATGGKMTTFRVMAHDALRTIRRRLPAHTSLDRRGPLFEEAPTDMLELDHLDSAARLRLLGRYGRDSTHLVGSARKGELELIPGTHTHWAELRWAARAEGVLHLDDLLLRRSRLGLISTQGAIPFLNDIRKVVQDELGWSQDKWQAEVAAYSQLWRSSYQLPTP